MPETNEQQNTVPQQNPVVELDLGNGNKLTREQALALKNKADGLEQGVLDFWNVAEVLKKKASDMETLAAQNEQSKKQVELSKVTLEAKIKELENQIGTYVSPEEYRKIKEERDLFVLKDTDTRIKALVAKGIPAESLTGKTVEQIAAIEEASTLIQTKVNPKVDITGSGPGGTPHIENSWDAGIEKAKEVLKRARGQ